MEEKQKVFKITAPICLGVSVILPFSSMAEEGAQQDTGASGPPVGALRDPGQTAHSTWLSVLSVVSSACLSNPISKFSSLQFWLNVFLLAFMILIKLILRAIMFI